MHFNDFHAFICRRLNDSTRFTASFLSHIFFRFLAASPNLIIKHLHTKFRSVLGAGIAYSLEENCSLNHDKTLQRKKAKREKQQEKRKNPPAKENIPLFFSSASANSIKLNKLPPAPSMASAAAKKRFGKFIHFASRES